MIINYESMREPMKLKNKVQDRPLREAFRETIRLIEFPIRETLSRQSRCTAIEEIKGQIFEQLLEEEI